MARYEIVIRPKANLSITDLERCLDFAKKLAQAMAHGGGIKARLLSGLPTQYYGGSSAAQQKTLKQTVGQESGKWTGIFAGNFAKTVDPSKKNKTGTAPAEHGYVMEDATYTTFKQLFGDQYKEADFDNDIEGDYVFNKPDAKPKLGFPIDFRGQGRGGARPDWRLRLLSSPGEALFDSTSARQSGHLAEKTVDGTPLGDPSFVQILFGAEIIYETEDVYFDTSCLSAKNKAIIFWFVVLGFGAGLYALQQYLFQTGQAPDPGSG